ncbi:MAG TPA: hypothetical protein VFA67_16170 [Candidatus Sulfotelmatobacter sp.]|nr:hypothetical protein [Candidatus Sulfotelmatobacter sp.]
MAETESSTLPAVSQFDENTILACNSEILRVVTRLGFSKQEATALLNIAGKTCSRRACPCKHTVKLAQRGYVNIHSCDDGQCPCEISRLGEINAELLGNIIALIIRRAFGYTGEAPYLHLFRGALWPESGNS